MSTLAAAALGLSLGLWCGTLVGAIVMLWIDRRPLRPGRTGAVSGHHTPERVPHLAEVSAQKALVEQAIERGIDEVMARNPGMSRKQARERAELLWQKAGDPLGGVQ